MHGKKILIVDDDALIRHGLKRILEERNCQVEDFSCGHLAIERLQQSSFDLVVTDLKMPGMSGMEVLASIRILQPSIPIIIITGYSTVETAVVAMKLGAVDYLAKPFIPDEFCHRIKKALDQSEAKTLQDQFAEHEVAQGFEDFIGKSAEMQKIYRRIMQVAPTTSTVLITGESGTGKELVAKAIHKLSPRRNQPFVAVDCTSLAENLLESELFGHIKGSFTGAVHSKAGLFKVADGGTLFLDEVANITLTTQAKLLRVLQERQVTPIGGTQPMPINIRLVAATNRQLREMVANGTFREDLYFRLNIIPINLPPLRERKGDLHILIQHFMQRFADEVGKDVRKISNAAVELLENYSFPGNIRELENLIERAMVFVEDNIINIDDLELNARSGERKQLPLPESIPQSMAELHEQKRLLKEKAVEPLERAFLVEALRRNDGNVTRAAEEVGMQRTNFHALLRKLGITGRELTE